MSVLILRYQPDKHDLEPPIPMAHQLEPIEESPDDPYDEDVFSSEAAHDPTGAAQKAGKVKDDQRLISNGTTSTKPEYGTFASLLSRSDFLASKIAMVRRHMHIWSLRLGFPDNDCLPNVTTAKTAILFVGLLLVSETITCVILVFAGSQIMSGQWWAVLLLAISLVAVVACFIIILRQPQNK